VKVYVTLSTLEIGTEEGETLPSLLMMIASACARTSPTLNAKVDVLKRSKANIHQNTALFILLSSVYYKQGLQLNLKFA
jgi:hypothetical protein